MNDEERRAIRQVRQETKGQAEHEMFEVSMTGEWTNGQANCLLGAAVINLGGRFTLGKDGKYIPANQKTIELCESIIKDHPEASSKNMGKLFKIKAQRIAEAKGETDAI